MHLATDSADLHLHTRCSDGSYTPAELVQAAQRAGLAAIAVTDHDTMAGAAEAQRAGATAGVEVIPGVEITSRVGEQEIHMLGYFFGDGWTSPFLKAVFDQAKKIRAQRVARFVAKLNELGFALTVEDVVAASVSDAKGLGKAAGDGGHDTSLGRPHVAMALVRRGHVHSLDEAFERFLKRGKPAFVDRDRMTVNEAIGEIRRAGGAAVLAHPGLYRRVDDALGGMIAAGLAGVEVWHPRHSPADTARYRQLADRLGLIATGGSDDHGPGRDALLGTVKVPYACVEQLRTRAAFSAVILSEMSRSPESAKGKNL